ncbi:MAG: murein L,D-transpeptidase catalytic domain family protein [Rikenellaceae bacterium]|nr:murein L,D-transpeptidase catalytic domain family protein [Rikenellaceae bacterium]
MLTAWTIGNNPEDTDHTRESESEKITVTARAKENPSVERLYRLLGLESEIDYRAFERAYTGYRQIGEKQKDMLVFIDFTKPSNQQRLYVIDLKERQILYKTHVAHGVRSGDLYARDFSNVNGSHKSSLGFFLTAETYVGKAEFSLKIDGLEKGINDNARMCGVVIHGADYVSPERAALTGKLGRSQGYPALPKVLNKPIIETIKGGAVVFIYAEDHNTLPKVIL